MTWANAGRPGDVVTCEKGHEIADVVSHFSPQGIVAAEYFGNWRDGSAPKSGDKINQQCPTCGALWLQHRTVAIAKAAADNRGFVPSGLCIHLRD